MAVNMDIEYPKLQRENAELKSALDAQVSIHAREVADLREKLKLVREEAEEHYNQSREHQDKYQAELAERLHDSEIKLAERDRLLKLAEDALEEIEDGACRLRPGQYGAGVTVNAKT